MTTPFLIYLPKGMKGSAWAVRTPGFERETLWFADLQGGRVKTKEEICAKDQGREAGRVNERLGGFRFISNVGSSVEASLVV